MSISQIRSDPATPVPAMKDQNATDPGSSWNFDHSRPVPSGWGAVTDKTKNLCR